VKRFRKRLLGTLVALAALGSAAPIEAGTYVGGPGFPEGTTSMVVSGAGTLGTAYVSYAVINTGGATAAATLKGLFGTDVNQTYGSNAVFTTATNQYIYIYEVVNTSTKGNTAAPLGALTVGNASPFSSAGEISKNTGDYTATTGTSVFDNTSAGVYPKGAVGPTADGWNGNSGTAGNADYTSNSKAATLSAIQDYLGNLQFQFQPDKLNTSGTYTTLMFAVSSNKPTSTTGNLSDGGIDGSGKVPTPVASPEPTSVAMMGLAVFGLGGWAGWRRRFGKQQS
jgi:hypothetical protein